MSAEFEAPMGTNSNLFSF